ncbi:MAG: C40 family peptidase [Deltaproteobacteria bacterium]|nr:C40 family peptidase [Deltaproteobacteria bacterium]
MITRRRFARALGSYGTRALVVLLSGLAACDAGPSRRRGEADGAAVAEGDGAASQGGLDGGVAGDGGYRLPVGDLGRAAGDSRAKTDQGPGCTLSPAEYEASLTADFASRDQLPQSPIPKADWNKYEGGPWAAKYPKPKIPACVDPLQWQRDRAVAVAKKYVGKVPYMHAHIPAFGGLDCSNFTSWVYNYGLGIQFDSGVANQGETVGRKLGAKEALKAGDLLFFSATAGGPSTHSAVFVEGDKFIHSNPTPQNGVQNGTLTDWYKDKYTHARRIVE